MIFRDLNSELFRNDKYNEILGPYNYKYPNVVITGSFPLYRKPINTINDLKYSFYYNGLPKISSTPLGVNSMYNRFPYINQGSLQTSQI